MALTAKRKKAADPAPAPANGTAKKNKLIPLDPEPFYDLYRHGVTQGMLARAHCPRKMTLAMTRGLSMPRISGPLAFGSVIHEALDQIYSYQKTSGHLASPREVLAAMEKKDRDKLYQMPASEPGAEEAMEESYGIALALLNEYFRIWEHDYKNFKWLSLEEVFKVPYSVKDRLGLDKPDIPVRGKFDGVLRIKGKIWLFETKTKSQINEGDIVDKLGFDLQVFLYLWAIEKIYGERPVGVIYNVVRRPSLKQGKRSLQEFVERVEADIQTRSDWYFKRFNAAVAESDLREWEGDLDSLMRDVIEWWEGRRTHRDSSRCTGQYGACEFLRLCGGGEEHLYQKRDHVYPELHEGEGVD